MRMARFGVTMFGRKRILMLALIDMVIITLAGPCAI